MKLCKDCKFCCPGFSGIPCLPFTHKKEYDIAECSHPESKDVRTDLITGKQSVSYTSCWIMRCFACGEEGKYWEAE